MKHIALLTALLTLAIAIVKLLTILSQKDALKEQQISITFYICIILLAGVAFSFVYFTKNNEPEIPSVASHSEKRIGSFRIINQNQEDLFEQVDTIISSSQEKMTFRKNINAKQIDIFATESPKILLLNPIEIHVKFAPIIRKDLEFESGSFKTIELTQ